MSDNNNFTRWHFEDPALFKEAINYTAAKTGFNLRLIEKDYFSSLVLEYLKSTSEELIFKGGTCLAKVYTDFYRLSEDLDFCISTPPSASRTTRSKKIQPVKKHINSIGESLKNIGIETELTGHNESRQYIADLSYSSFLTNQPQRLKIEISLREETLLEPRSEKADTSLVNPLSGDKLLPPIQLKVLPFKELIAEKIRAALTRRFPAIRDFFDIYYSTQLGKLTEDNEVIIELVNEKLSVPGTKEIDISESKFGKLERQMETELKPVLSDNDFNEFELKYAYETVKNFGTKFNAG